MCVGRILTEHVGIIFGKHIAAAAPRFVADAYIVEFKRFFATVFFAERYLGSVVGAGDIVEPLCHITCRAGSQVDRQIRFASKTFAKCEKLVSTKCVVFHCVAPEDVFGGGTVFLRTNTVAPVVSFGKTSAWPAQYRDFQLFKSVEYVGTVAVLVSNGAVFAHPDTVVDTTSKVFGKLTVDFGGNHVSRLSVGGDFGFLSVGTQCGSQCRCK